MLNELSLCVPLSWSSLDSLIIFRVKSSKINKCRSICSVLKTEMINKLKFEVSTGGVCPVNIVIP